MRGVVLVLALVSLAGCSAPAESGGYEITRTTTNEMDREVRITSHVWNPLDGDGGTGCQLSTIFERMDPGESVTGNCTVAQRPDADDLRVEAFWWEATDEITDDRRGQIVHPVEWPEGGADITVVLRPTGTFEVTVRET